MFKFLLAMMKSMTLGKWFHLFLLLSLQVWKGMNFLFGAACKDDGSAQNKTQSEYFEILVVGAWALCACWHSFLSSHF